MQRRGRGGAFEGARQMHYSRFQEISRVFEPLYKQEVSEVTIPLYSRVADFQRSLTRYRRALKERKKKKGKVPVARKWLVTKASEEIGKIITISFSRFATLANNIRLSLSFRISFIVLRIQSKIGERSRND